MDAQLEARLETLAITLRSEFQAELARREHERFMRGMKAFWVFMVLVAIVLWTIILTKAAVG
jgi:hypothetical protein